MTTATQPATTTITELNPRTARGVFSITTESGAHYRISTCASDNGAVLVSGDSTALNRELLVPVGAFGRSTGPVIAVGQHLELTRDGEFYRRSSRVIRIEQVSSRPDPS